MQELLGHKVSDAVGRLHLRATDWRLEDGTGGPEIPRHVWPSGGFFRAFKRLTADEVGQLATLEELVSEIATHLWWWHQRLKQADLLQ